MNDLIPQKISEEIESIVAEMETAYYDIPFENSAFQNINFVVNQQLTPERAYRAIGLRLSAKLRALKEVYFGRQLEEIDIAELEEKRDNPSTNKFDRQRAELEIQKKMSNRNYTNKLINDALVEVKTLYDEMKKLPRYTREQFEAGERRHFEVRLQHQIQGINGASEALLAMQTEAVTTQAQKALLRDQRAREQALLAEQRKSAGTDGPSDALSSPPPGAPGSSTPAAKPTALDLGAR